MPDIRLINLSKRWGPVTAVSDVNLDIADGEFVVFLGPSGCGKTTTMRMIAGLESVSEGEIRIGGKLVNSLEPKAATFRWFSKAMGFTPTSRSMRTSASPCGCARCRRISTTRG